MRASATAVGAPKLFVVQMNGLLSFQELLRTINNVEAYCKKHTIQFRVYRILGMCTFPSHKPMNVIRSSFHAILSATEYCTLEERRYATVSIKGSKCLLGISKIFIMSSDFKNTKH
jgi:hypothetical protein